MDFLKRLFGGDRQTRDDGYYIYVQPKMCKEIVRVRINLSNDLSLKDDNETYWVRKMVSATRCPFQAELTLYFDKSRRLLNKDISNGDYVDETAYQAYLVSSGQAEAES